MGFRITDFVLIDEKTRETIQKMLLTDQELTNE